MNNLISKYGTFIIITPLLAIIACIALRFNVTIRGDVTLVQTAPGEITAYLPPDAPLSDTLRVETTDFGTLTLPLITCCREPAAQKATCRGTLPADDTLLRASITTGTKPLYSILIH